MNGISLIIPTYKRTIDLERTLKSIVKQTNDIEEVIVVIGPNDEDSYLKAISFEDKIYNLKIIQNEKVSVVNALNTGLINSTHDIICMTDDDVEVPDGWANRIKNAFVNDNQIGVYGGPDKLQHDTSNPDLDYNPVQSVGIFKWNKMIGNHHLGVLESPAIVDVLKGVNFSFRRSAIKDLSIDTFLERKGAEQCWEIDLCQKIQANGYKLVYDNSNFLYHYTGQRQIFDIRTDVYAETNFYNLLNSNYVYAKFRPLFHVFIKSLKDVFIGSKISPGFIRAVLMLNDKDFKILIIPVKNIKFISLGIYSGLRKRLNTKGAY